MTKRLFYQQSEPGSRIAATAQRLSVKARIMMALFALMLIPQGAWAQGAAGNSYNLWIGGTRVTDANKGAILSPGRGDSVKVINSAETWSLEFDSERSVLILKNVDIQREIRSGLDNLTIRFEGTNKINSDARSTDYLIAASAHANSLFTYDPTSTSNPLPLHPSATLTIEKSGDGSLELDGRDTYSAVKGFASVSYGSGCYLKSDVATTYNENLKLYECFCGGGNVDVVTITTDTFYPLWFYYKETTSPFTTHFKQVDGSNYSNISTETLTKGTISFDPANSKLSLNDVYFDGKILSSLGDLTINLTGTNQINLRDSGTCILSAKSGKLTLEKAAPNASLKLDCWQWNPTHPVIQGFTSLVYPDFSLVTSDAANYGNFFDDNSNSNTILGLYYPGETDNTIKAVNDALFTSVVNYGLSIAGTPVTSANAGNVFAGDALYDGKVTFLPDATTANSGKLTLNGFEKTDANAAIESSLDNLTIEFKGTNELGNSNVNNGYIKSTKATATLTFKGGAASSTLNLKSPSDAIVQGFASVSYDGAYWNYSGPITYDTSSRKYVNEWGDLTILTITTTPQYLLWIESLQVSADGSGKTGATYDDASKTLTLNECSILSMDGIVSALPSLNIKLKGNNSVGTWSSTRTPIVSSVSTATLNIQTADGEDNCSLVLTTMGSDPVVKGFASVSHTGLDLVVTAGTGTTLDAATTYGATLSVSAYPLWIGSKQVNVANAGNVLSGTANDGKVSYVHDATNNTGTLTLNNAQLVGDIATSMSDLTIHIKGGCEIRAKSNCIRSSATTPGTLTFTREGAGDLTLNNINAVDPYNPSNTKMTAIKGFKTLAGLPLITKEPYEIDAYCRLKKSMSSDTATIDYAWVNADVTYPLWVKGNQVTSENKSNVLEEATATVSFDVDKNTLTLDGANISDSIISDLASLTIGLIGDNSVFQGIRSSKATTSLTIAKDATATGNVSLLVETQYAYAIWGFNSLTYTGFTPYTSDGTIDLTSTISYTSTDRALKDGGSKLNGVKFVSKTDLSASGLSFSMDSKTYSGSAVVLPGNVTMNDGTNNIPLTATSDYTVTGYKDANGNSLTSGAPTDAGSYYATISGEGVYMGTADVPFTINPITASLSWDTTTPLIFNGTPQAPAVSVSNLLRGESCTVTVIGQETNAGTSYTATATALSNNNYQLPKTGLTQTFKIDPVNLSTSTTLSISTIDNQTYSGSEIKPTPTVNIKLGTSTTETPLVASTDFDYSYSNNTNAALSTAASAPTVTITGKGNYEGTKVVKFTIDQVDMSTSTDITIEAVPDQTYTGSAITPTPTVKFKGNDLVAGTGNDFVYGYLNNINLASSTDPTAPPTVTITGNGNFKNTTSVKFTIKEQEASVNFGTRDYITFYNSTTGNLLVPDNVKAYIVTGVNGNEVVVDQVSFITPATAVLMEKAPGWKNVKDNMLHSGNLLKFAFSDIDATGKKYYVLYNNEFVRATGTIPIGRNYLDLSAIVNPARTLIIGGNNSATAIEAVSEEVADGEDKWYDMQGRQINKPSKAGLYIKNGKKVVVNNK